MSSEGALASGRGADWARRLSSLDDDGLRQALGAIVHEYSVRAQRRFDDDREIPSPMSNEGPATATDVMITARNMLRVFEIAPFELSFLPY
ncbi:MAG: hypothetical protein J2P19_11175 [Pseudonocardia sp.]|nr:hypothetical protein [Pseudonocardia sp.]